MLRFIATLAFALICADASANGGLAVVQQVRVPRTPIRTAARAAFTRPAVVVAPQAFVAPYVVRQQFVVPRVQQFVVPQAYYAPQAFVVPQVQAFAVPQCQVQSFALPQCQSSAAFFAY